MFMSDAGSAQRRDGPWGPQYLSGERGRLVTGICRWLVKGSQGPGVSPKEGKGLGENATGEN